jgi:hypothetical protein
MTTQPGHKPPSSHHQRPSVTTDPRGHVGLASYQVSRPHSSWPCWQQAQISHQQVNHRPHLSRPLLQPRSASVARALDAAAGASRSSQPASHMPMHICCVPRGMVPGPLTHPVAPSQHVSRQYWEPLVGPSAVAPHRQQPAHCVAPTRYARHQGTFRAGWRRRDADTLCGSILCADTAMFCCLGNKYEEVAGRSSIVYLRHAFQ